MQSSSTDAESQLQTGITLTHRGLFADAIPHFLAAQGHVSDEYAADFDLALCYVATEQFKLALQVLDALSKSGKGTADVENLLAQAYIGSSQPDEAFKALQKAAKSEPQNEKLYLFIVDACTARKTYELGVRVVDFGLSNLPRSAKLHYQRAMTLTQLDELDMAIKDFELAASLAPGSDIAYIAASQQALFQGNTVEAIRSAREGMEKGHEDSILLAILGDALIRSGISPGQPEFIEAETALEKSVAEKPNYAGSQIDLGKLYLMNDRLDDAIAHLESGRRLDAQNPSVYSSLATAYRRTGQLQKAQQMIVVLTKLNDEQANQIRAAPGDRKSNDGAAGLDPSPQATASHN